VADKPGLWIVRFGIPRQILIGGGSNGLRFGWAVITTIKQLGVKRIYRPKGSRGIAPTTVVRSDLGADRSTLARI
jgi:hypothetical protein